MADIYENTPFKSLPEERQEMIKDLINSSCENVSKMNPEQKESMLSICYQTLEPEFREIDVKEFNCNSYSEFICQMILAAAAVDKNFVLEEEEAVAEFMKTIGLIGQPFEGDIAKIEKIDFDLVKLSSKLKPGSRGMFMTFVLLIFLCDEELAYDEYKTMINIMAP